MEVFIGNTWHLETGADLSTLYHMPFETWYFPPSLSPLGYIYCTCHVLCLLPWKNSPSVQCNWQCIIRWGQVVNGGELAFGNIVLVHRDPIHGGTQSEVQTSPQGTVYKNEAKVLVCESWKEMNVGMKDDLFILGNISFVDERRL